MIDWKESGGPPVQPPSRRGFGTTIIERSIPFDLKGDAELRFDLLGVQAQVRDPGQLCGDGDVDVRQSPRASRPKSRRRRACPARR